MTTTRSTAVIPRVISLDDHVVEPPNLFERWLPQRYREYGPKVVRGPWQMGGNRAAPIPIPATEGPITDFWAFEDVRKTITVTVAWAGRTRWELTTDPIRYDEMRPGCYDATARLADMDMNHMDKSLCFPTMSRFCGQMFSEAKDLELGMACIKAYNDWMADEWTADSGGRLLPMALVPLWDPSTGW